MLKKPLNYYDEYEKDYPGFQEMVIRYELEKFPACPHCGSSHTAKVSPGIVSRSIHLMSATTKFRIHPKPPGKFYCNDCEQYFTPQEDQP